MTRGGISGFHNRLADLGSMGADIILLSSAT
jgi:hypothetical protein